MARSHQLQKFIDIPADTRSFQRPILRHLRFPPTALFLYSHSDGLLPIITVVCFLYPVFQETISPKLYDFFSSSIDGLRSKSLFCAYQHRRVQPALRCAWVLASLSSSGVSVSSVAKSRRHLAYIHTCCYVNTRTRASAEKSLQQAHRRLSSTRVLAKVVPTTESRGNCQVVPSSFLFNRHPYRIFISPPSYERLDRPQAF